MGASAAGPGAGVGVTTIGYLVKRFPRLSETFILDEILGLEAAGLDLRLFAIADPHEPVIQPDVARVRSPVVYLRAGGVRAGLGAAIPTLVAHSRLFARSPRRYLRLIAYIALKRRHIASIRHFLEAGRLALALERQGATRIHAAFAHGPATVAHFVHLLTGMPFSFAGHAKDLYRSPPELLARKVADADFVLVCSDSAARMLRELAGPAGSKIVLARHGVSTERFAPRGRPGARGEFATATTSDLSGLLTHINGGEPVLVPLRLLAVGRLVAKKGYPVLLEALARTIAAGHAVSLTIIGTGDERGPVEALVERLGLAGSVCMLGACTQQQVAAALRDADAFVQASRVLADGDRDGIPNALLEAMAAGLAVVATCVGGIPEVIADGVTGLLVAPEDPGALADALGRLADDPALRARLGAGARAHAVASLDRVPCARAIVPLFNGHRVDLAIGLS